MTVTLATMGFEAATIADILGVPSHSVQPMMVLHGTTVPWGEQYLGGVALLPARRLAATLLGLSPQFSDQQVTYLTHHVMTRLRPAV